MIGMHGLRFTVFQSATAALVGLKSVDGEMLVATDIGDFGVRREVLLVVLIIEHLDVLGLNDLWLVLGWPSSLLLWRRICVLTVLIFGHLV